MAYYFNETSHTFNEYLLVPGYSSAECIPANVSLKTPLVKFKKGEEPAISMNIPMVSAIMQSVSGEKLAVALAREGGVSFIYGSQTVEDEAAMVARAKTYKAGFVVSASNVSVDSTLQDILDLKEKNGFSTVAVTSDGTANGKLLGIVTSRDYRVSRMDRSTRVADFMTPLDKLVVADEDTTLKQANDIIWDNKLNSLPIVDAEGNLKYFVFRKDYDAHKENPNELLDAKKRYVVGAGINTRDYAQRVPALIEAGADVLCIDSSEGFSEWQKLTIAWIREHYGDSVKVGDATVNVLSVGKDSAKVEITRNGKKTVKEFKNMRDKHALDYLPSSPAERARWQMASEDGKVRVQVAMLHPEGALTADGKVRLDMFSGVFSIKNPQAWPGDPRFTVRPDT